MLGYGLAWVPRHILQYKAEKPFIIPFWDTRCYFNVYICIWQIDFSFFKKQLDIPVLDGKFIRFEYFSIVKVNKRFKNTKMIRSNFSISLKN